MKAQSVIVNGAVILSALFLCVSLVKPISHYIATGHSSSLDDIDTLNSPKPVQGWGEDGIKLNNGTLIKLPEFTSLPVESAALTEATKRGIETTENGRVIGLVRIYQWCGTYPSGEHIVRVDLSHYLTFLGEGKRITPHYDPDFSWYEPSGRFSKWGWRIDDYMMFTNFSSRYSYVSEQNAAEQPASRPAVTNK